MKRNQMMISFGAYDDDVYDFLQKEKNASAFIRRLVRAHMSGSLPPTQPMSTDIQPIAMKESMVTKMVEENEDFTPAFLKKKSPENIKDKKKNNKEHLKNLNL